MKLSIDDIAYAMELHQEGVSIESAAYLLGVSRTTLNRCICAAKRYGYSFWSQPTDAICPRVQS